MSSMEKRIERYSRRNIYALWRSALIPVFLIGFWLVGMPTSWAQNQCEVNDGYALQFTEKDKDYVSINLADPSYLPDFSQGITIEAWVQMFDHKMWLDFPNLVGC